MQNNWGNFSKVAFLPYVRFFAGQRGHGPSGPMVYTLVVECQLRQLTRRNYRQLIFDRPSSNRNTGPIALIMPNPEPQLDLSRTFLRVCALCHTVWLKAIKFGTTIHLEERGGRLARLARLGLASNLICLASASSSLPLPLPCLASVKDIAALPRFCLDLCLDKTALSPSLFPRPIRSHADRCSCLTR